MWEKKQQNTQKQLFRLLRRLVSIAAALASFMSDPEDLFQGNN